MFSGIVEAQGRIFHLEAQAHLIRISVERPHAFDDLKVGDSIANDGVCLTLESFEQSHMQFALGPETLQITGWRPENLKNRSVNLERSLRFGDRIHGHLVTGHVDGLGVVELVEPLGESQRLRIRPERPEIFRGFVWKKGSWAVNGVSLTINEVQSSVVEHVLIPETLKRTNLAALKTGDRVNLEIDMMARALVHSLRESSHEHNR